MRAMGFITRFFSQSKPLIIEALGTFLLVLVGTGALTALQISGEGTTSSFMLISMLAFSGVFGWLVYLLGSRQLGYFNPAISFFLWLKGSLPLAQLAAVILMQLIGAVVGSILVALLYGPSAVDSGLGAVHVMSNMGPFAGVVAEALGMIFVLATLAKISNENVSSLRRGVMLGGALALGQFISLGVSGGALNPARALAPQLVVADARDWWVYWVGPLAGAALVWLGSNWLLTDAPAAQEHNVFQPHSESVAASTAEADDDSEAQVSLQQRARQALAELRHKTPEPEPEPKPQEEEISQSEPAIPEAKQLVEPEAEPQYDELPAAPIMPSFSEEPVASAVQPEQQTAALSRPQASQPQSVQSEPSNPQPQAQPSAVRFVNFEHPSEDGEE